MTVLPTTDINALPFDPWPEADVHIEHGATAARLAAKRGDLVVVIDVLSFSTTLSIAVERGAAVAALSAEQIETLGGRDAVAESIDAHVVAKDRSDVDAKFTLSPASLSKVEKGDRLVLTSLNGARMVAAAEAAPEIVSGSLRSATATAALLDELISTGRRRITLIAATEQWSSVAPGKPGDRTATEDWLGAGIIAANLASHGRSLSVEAEIAAEMALRSESTMAETLARTVSGRELIRRGFADDVELAALIDASPVAASLHPDGFFREAR